MEVTLPQKVNSTECIRCGKCMSACPEGAISFRFGRVEIKEEYR